MIFPCKRRQGKLVQSRKMKVDRGYDFHLKIPGSETAVREKNYLNLSVTKLSLETDAGCWPLQQTGEDSLSMGTAGTRQVLLTCKFSW